MFESFLVEMKISDFTCGNKNCWVMLVITCTITCGYYLHVTSAVEEVRTISSEPSSTPTKINSSLEPFSASSKPTKINSSLEPFSEVLHPFPLNGPGPNLQNTNPGDQGKTRCFGFKDGWPVPLYSGDCHVHQTNKRWLSENVDVKKVRVLHVVKTVDKYLQTRVIAVKETWGKRLSDINPQNKVFFLKSGAASKDPQVISVAGNPDKSGLFNRVIDGLELLANRYQNETDWYHVVDDDIYLIPQLLLRYIAHFDPTEPILLAQVSRQFVSRHHCIPAANGGGGMILSKAAVKILLEKGRCPRTSGLDDTILTNCLLQAGVKPTCVHDPEGKLRMMSRHPHDILQKGSGRYFRASIFPRFNENPFGQDTFSKELVSWNHAAPEEMYFYDFLLYQHTKVQP